MDPRIILSMTISTISTGTDPLLAALTETDMMMERDSGR